MKSKSSLNKIFYNSFIILSGNIGANIFGMLSVAIFTHSMGAKVFGYYILFLSFIEIIDRIFNFQTWQAFIKYASDFQVKDERYNLMMLLKFSFLVDFISLIIAFIVAMLSVDMMLDFFDIPVMYRDLVLLMNFSLLLNVLNISTGVFRFFDEFKIQSQILIYSAFLKFVLFGIIATVAPSFGNFVIVTVFTKLFVFIMNFHYLKKILNSNDMYVSNIARVYIDYPMMKELRILSFIIYNNFDVAVRMVSRQLDVILLGKFFGAEMVGIYRVAVEVANIIGKLTDPVYQAIYPEFTKLLASNNRQELLKVARKISLYAGIAGVVFYVLFIFFGEFSIGLVFGEEFKVAYNVTLVYFFAIFLAIITFPLYPMQHAFGFAKDAFTNQLHATLVYFPVLIVLTFQYEMIGASIAYIGYYIYLTRLTLKSVMKGFR